MLLEGVFTSMKPSRQSEAVSVAPGPWSVSGFAVTWRTLPGSTTCVPSHSPRARLSCAAEAPLSATPGRTFTSGDTTLGPGDAARAAVTTHAQPAPMAPPSAARPPV